MVMARRPRHPHRRRGRLHPEAQNALDEQRRAFIEKFGREPGPGDPILFDPDADTPTPMDPDRVFAGTIMAMIKTGTRHELIYGFIRTGGMIFTAETAHLWAAEDLALWDKAIEEYRKDFSR